MSVSLMQYVGGIVTAIFNPSELRDDDNSVPSGPQAVRQAMNELQGLQNKEFEAKLGLPDIVKDTESEFFTDPKVVIPLNDVPYDGANRLVFDLPQGADDKLADLNRLMDALGVDALEDLEGKTVPLGFIGGNEAVLWDQLIDTDQQAPPQEAPSEVVTEDKPADSKADEAASDSKQKPSASESSVNVEEKTVSPDGGSEASSGEGTAEDNDSM